MSSENFAPTGFWQPSDATVMVYLDADVNVDKSESFSWQTFDIRNASNSELFEALEAVHYFWARKYEEAAQATNDDIDIDFDVWKESDSFGHVREWFVVDYTVYSLTFTEGRTVHIHNYETLVSHHRDMCHRFLRRFPATRLWHNVPC